MCLDFRCRVQKADKGNIKVIPTTPDDKRSYEVNVSLWTLTSKHFINDQ